MSLDTTLEVFNSFLLAALKFEYVLAVFFQGILRNQNDPSNFSNNLSKHNLPLHQKLCC